MIHLTLVCRYPVRRGTQTDRDVCGATATYTDLTLTGAANAAKEDGWAVASIVAGMSVREDSCPLHHGRTSLPPLPAAAEAMREDRSRIRGARQSERIPS